MAYESGMSVSYEEISRTLTVIFRGKMKEIKNASGNDTGRSKKNRGRVLPVSGMERLKSTIIQTMLADSVVDIFF